MDKLTTEQKAERYVQVLDRAKKWRSAPNIDKMPTYGNRIIEEIFPELKESESEDERIRKEIYWFFTQPDTVCDERWIAWLEKQKAVDILDEEEREFADNVDSYRKEVDAAYQKGYNEGVKATLEKQGTSKKDATREKVAEYLKNLILDQSQRGFPMLNYEGRIEEEVDFIINIAKKELKQDEQKYADKVKFNVGDWVVSPNGVYWHIDKISNNRYEVTSNTGESSNWPLDINIYHKFTIQDAKKGDILACNKCILIFDQLSEFNNEQVLMDICHCTSKGFYWQDTKDRDLWVSDGFKPATKDQRNTLFAKIKEAGYEWDAEHKQLKKIEQKSAWSEEDEKMVNNILTPLAGRFPWNIYQPMYDWLKSLKDRVGFETDCTTMWKPSEKQMEALKEACDEHWEPDGLDPLYTLYQELKKLREVSYESK